MRSAAEWLVLPLFVLPLLLALGVHLWARAEHQRTLDRYRFDGAAEAARWLDPNGGAAAWIPSRWSADLETLQAGRSPDQSVAFAHPTLRGRVDLGRHRLTAAPWRFVEGYPAGLAPAALTNPETRLRIETGAAPASLEGVDEATRAFRDLLTSRDLDRLRTAPLSVATKRYVVRTWQRGGVAPIATPDAVRFLDLASAAIAAFAPHPEHAGVGVHEVGAAQVVRGGVAEPLLVLPRGETDRVAHPSGYVARDGRGDAVRLVYGTPPADGQTVLWTGTMDRPLAGTWSFVRDGGAAWWQSSRFRSWLVPGLALLLVFLAIPASLWSSLRRRRLRDAARTRFLNEVAHDLRTPLTSLRLQADLLASGRTSPERTPASVALIQREAIRMTGLLANLLDFSRLDGKTRVELEPVPVARAVDQAARAFALVHPDRSEDLTTDGPDRTFVLADPSALGRVLGNLLDNAGKFTPAGTALHITWTANGADTVLRVSDEGPGIAPAERGQVFRRYARGQVPKRDGVPGSGLGLALVKELVTAMDGTVRLTPSAVGATFEVRLPSAAGKADA